MIWYLIPYQLSEWNSSKNHCPLLHMRILLSAVNFSAIVDRSKQKKPVPKFSKFAFEGTVTCTIFFLEKAWSERISVCRWAHSVRIKIVSYLSCSCPDNRKQPASISRNSQRLTRYLRLKFWHVVFEIPSSILWCMHRTSLLKFFIT